MGIFDRFRNIKQAPASDYERLSALRGDLDARDDLDDDDLKDGLVIKCIVYGISHYGDRIPGLFALSRQAVARLKVRDRLKLLTHFSSMTEQPNGKGHMGLMMFLAADATPAAQSSAAVSLSVLFDPEKSHDLADPAFFILTLQNRESAPETQENELAGVLLLGDKRVKPSLEKPWEQFPEMAQLAKTKAPSGFVTEGIVEFCLNCPESGCSESVFGSVVAAIAKMPAITQVPMVVHLERPFPTYAGDEPLTALRQTSFHDYLEQIPPRLDNLEEEESEPKLIPKIFEISKNPEHFHGLVG